MNFVRSVLKCIGEFWSVQPPPKKVLPSVRLHLVHEHTDGYVSPNPFRFFQCHKAEDDTVVGHISYGVSPLNDRIYVGKIEIYPEFRLQGYGSSLLLEVVTQHAVDGEHMPVTGLSEAETAVGFWWKLRQGAVPGLTVTMDLDVLESQEEPKRWAHLRAKSTGR